MSKKKHHNEQEYRVNRHHILFQSRHWERGYARALRNDPVFIVPLSVLLHNSLHATINDIHTPPGDMCRIAYEALMKDYRRISAISTYSKIEWIISVIPDEQFRRDMGKQLLFLTTID